MRRHNIAVGAAVGLVVAFAAQPLVPCLPNADDTLLHLYRLVELDYLLRQGILFPRWMPDLVFGYGYPLLNFYAPLSTYLSEAFHLVAGLTFRDSVAAAFGLCLLAATVGMYRLARDYVGKGPALLGAAAYTLAPYLLFNSYMRGSLSDALALALFPWVAWALRRAATGSARFIALASLSYAALILSHNVSSLAFTPVLLLLAVACALNEAGFGEVSPEDKAPAARTLPVRRFLTRMAPMLAALTVGLALSAFFWLPALAERGVTQLESFLSAPDYDFHNNFLAFSELVALPEPARAGLLNPAPPRSLGPVQVALALVGLGAAVWRRGRGELARTALIFGVALGGLVVMMLPLSAGAWERLPLVRYFEFPWRLLAQASFVTAFLAAAGVAFVTEMWPARGQRHGKLSQMIPSAVRWAPALAVGAAGLASLPYLYPPPACDVPASPGLAEVTAYQRDFGTLGVTSTGEYLPVWVDQPPREPPFPGADLGAPLSTKVDAASLPPDSQILSASGGALQARLRLKLARPGHVVFYVFDFPGWEARLDGRRVPIDHVAPVGRIGVEVPAGEHDLDLQFDTTPIRRLAELLSLAATVAWLLLLFPVRPAFGRFWPVGKGAAAPRQHLPGELGRLLPGRPRVEARPQTGPDAGPVALRTQWMKEASQDWPVVLALAGLLALKLGWVDGSGSPFRLGFDGQHVPAAAAPPAGNFDGTLSLLGYRTSATRARPGDALEVTLYWRTQVPPAEHYGSYIHLIDPDFKMYSQSENRVLDFASAMSWQPDTYLQDRHRLQVPPGTAPGKYWIEMGVYTSRNGKRLQVLDDAGHVLGRQLLLVPIKVFDPRAPLPAPAHRTDVTFGGSIRLAGYDVRPDTATDAGSAAEAAGGAPQRVHVTLYWQAVAPIAKDFTVFLHLEAATGQLLAQSDAQPAGGHLPTTSWDTGEFVTDDHMLDVSSSVAPGSYRLTAGLYTLQTGERLTITSPRDLAGDDAATLGEIAIPSLSP